jgi:putative flavoprotein involved in K+ transport
VRDSHEKEAAMASAVEHINTVVIGGGQAGLSVGYHLQQLGVPFVILDASARIGDSWRHRWDSLRVFTPAKFAGLDGWRFPDRPNVFPTKDQMADYFEAYARRFALPIRSHVRVERLSRAGDRFLIVAGNQRLHADHVVVAMANYQQPRVPALAGDFDPSITQLHSAEYRNPSQLRPGGVLLVGAGNSGAEIAKEVALAGHPAWLVGPDNGHVPFRIDGWPARLILVRLVLRVLFHRVLTIATPIGRRLRPKMVRGGTPLLRVRPKDLARLGIQRVIGRVTRVVEGRPALEDGRVLDVANVIWCTGYTAGFSWIDLPVFAPDGEPRHEGGRVVDHPGLFFVGLHFLYAVSSEMFHGVGRDAKRIAAQIADSSRAARRASRAA